MQRMSPVLRFRSPMECRHVERIPAGGEWQYELKLDGYRTQAIKQAGEAHLYSRNGKPFDDLFPEIAEAVGALRVKEIILDGEVVALDKQGRHSFSLLQNIRRKGAPIVYYAFDVLFLNGKDLMALPLRERRPRLEAIPLAKNSPLQLSPTFQGEPEEIIEKIREFGFEGIIAKQLTSSYRPGEETGAWLKHKTQQSADFLIGGYIPGRQGVEELVIGRKEGRDLVFVDTVKNGFVPATRANVFNAISKSNIADCPFSNLPEKKGAHRMDREKMEKVRWVKPRLIVEVAFNEITKSGHLRHAKFLRLRDKADVRRKQP